MSLIWASPVSNIPASTKDRLARETKVMHLLVDLDDTVANLGLHFDEMWQNRHPHDRFVKAKIELPFI